MFGKYIQNQIDFIETKVVVLKEPIIIKAIAAVMSLPWRH